MKVTYEIEMSDDLAKDEMSDNNKMAYAMFEHLVKLQNFNSDGYDFLTEALQEVMNQVSDS
jgi:hypothetical protein